MLGLLRCRLGGMARGLAFTRGPVAAGLLSHVAPKLSLAAPMLVTSAAPNFVVRVCGITVLSTTFSAMAMHSYCMDFLDEEVDMDFLDGIESVASAAEERAASAGEESAASAAEASSDRGYDDDFDDGIESVASAAEERAASAGEESAASAAEASSDRGYDDDFDDDIDAFPEPAAERVAAGTLQVGKEAEHDMLGMGTVLACARSKEVAPGVEVVFADHHDGKVLFSFVKRVKQGRSYVPQTVERWVFEDALTVITNNDGEDNTSTEAGPSGTSAFDEMQESAGANNAFTQGMSAPELAAHERNRKAKKAKDAAGARGRNTAERKTKEPKVDPSVRVAEFPDNSLCVDNGKLFCKACTKELSLRKVTVSAHCNQSKTHENNLAKYVETLGDDDQIRILISKYYEENTDVQGHTIAPDVHVCHGCGPGCRRHRLSRGMW
jgi:hypothetical protein